MSSGFAVMPFDAPGVLQSAVRFSAGAKKVWSVFVPGKDLTGFSALWLAGMPDQPELIGLENAPFLSPRVLIRKSTSDATIAMVVDSTGTRFNFTTVRADTIALAPRAYWQQLIAYDQDGEPTPIECGRLLIGPSMITLDGR